MAGLIASARHPTALLTSALGLSFAALVLVLAVPGLAVAQDTHVLVVAGVGGDEEHVKTFHQWASSVVETAKKQGVAPDNVAYLGESTGAATRASRDNVTKAFADMAARAKANDEIFVLLIGHGSFDGRRGVFNLSGPDLTAEDYGKLLARFPTQKIAFVNTASSSGAFLEPLKGPARTIVTATRTGGERNETRFPEYFVEALASEAADRDRNGRVSVLEAFDYATAKVKATYEQGGHILTEHATLDDGAQGKLAATLFLAPVRSRTAAAQAADPATRALLEQRDDLERRVGELRLRKDGMEAARYEEELEQLLTELALKTKAIRDLEGQK
ncbi:MAG: hypothetical protein GEU82_11405 [Luteitalea sp.]|nr:hypothetical protein [Luteitalea sp.]